MGLRVIATLIISFGGMIASFVSAFYGLLTYAFWSYTSPEIATWGTLPIGKLSYFVGLVLVGTTFMQYKRLFSNNFQTQSSEKIILAIIIMVNLIYISSFFAPIEIS